MAGVNGFANEARVISEAIIGSLERIAESAEKQLIRDQYRYINKILNVPATDTVVQDTVTPPPGVIWIVRRFGITGGVNGAFAVYLNEAQPQNLLDGSFANAAIDAWAVTGGGLYIPFGQSLVLRFYSQPNSQMCTVNLAITEVEVTE